MKKLLIVCISLTLAFCDAVLAKDYALKKYYTDTELMQLQAEFKLPEPLGLPRTVYHPILFEDCKKNLGEYHPHEVYNDTDDYYMEKRWHREHVAVILCARRGQRRITTTMTYFP